MRPDDNAGPRTWAEYQRVVRTAYTRAQRLLDVDDYPRVTYLFWFGRHASASDLKPFQKHFERADIIVPEICGWSASMLNALRRATDTDSLRVDDVLAGISCLACDGVEFAGTEAFASDAQEKFSTAFWNMLRRSEKVVVLADVPQEHVIAEAFRSLEDSVMQGNIVGDVEDYITMLQQEREIHIAGHLPLAVRTALDTYPNLIEKEQLHVAIQLGAQHFRLGEVLKSESTQIRIDAF